MLCGHFTLLIFKKKLTCGLSYIYMYIYIYMYSHMCVCVYVRARARVLIHFSHVQLFSWWCYGLWPTKLLCPWNSQGKSTEVNCHALFQEIFPTQRLSPHLLCLQHWQVGSLSLAQPEILFVVFFQIRHIKFYWLYSYFFLWLLGVNQFGKIYTFLKLRTTKELSMFVSILSWFHLLLNLWSTQN